MISDGFAVGDPPGFGELRRRLRNLAFRGPGVDRERQGRGRVPGQGLRRLDARPRVRQVGDVGAPERVEVGEPVGRLVGDARLGEVHPHHRRRVHAQVAEDGPARPPGLEPGAEPLRQGRGDGLDCLFIILPAVARHDLDRRRLAVQVDPLWRQGPEFLAPETGGEGQGVQGRPVGSGQVPHRRPLGGRPDELTGFLRGEGSPGVPPVAFGAGGLHRQEGMGRGPPVFPEPPGQPFDRLDMVVDGLLVELFEGAEDPQGGRDPRRGEVPDLHRTRQRQDPPGPVDLGLDVLLAGPLRGQVGLVLRQVGRQGPPGLRRVPLGPLVDQPRLDLPHPVECRPAEPLGNALVGRALPLDLLADLVDEAVKPRPVLPPESVAVLPGLRHPQGPPVVPFRA